MILDVTGSGLVSTAVRDAVVALGEEVRAAVIDEDLFDVALGCRAIVYAPEPLLDGTLDPKPSDARMRAVLRASNAPGVYLVVVVLPAGGAFAEEEHVLRKDGKPYVVVRSAPLVEELAAATDFAATRSLWLPDVEKKTAIATKGALRDAVRRALSEDALQGDVLDVVAEEVTLPEAMRRAARAAGAPTAVHVAPKIVHAAASTVASWFGYGAPALKLYERMAAA